MVKKELFKVKIVGTDLNSARFDSLLRKIEAGLERTNFRPRFRSRQKHRLLVVTPNPEFVVLAQKHPWFKNVLNRADVAIPDGIGLILASRFLSQDQGLKTGDQRLKERIPGVDLMIRLCQKAAEKSWTVYFFGGQPKIAQKALKNLQKRFPGLKGWAEAGPKLSLDLKTGQIKPQEAVKAAIKRINAKQPDLLFVGLGMGKQEKFLDDHWSRLKVKLGAGIGGSFDFLSGQTRRAPVWVRQMGLEWLFRLIQEPWRWKRQLALIEFVILVLKEKLRKKKD